MKVDEFDSGKMLAHAARQAKQRGYDKFPIVDVDSHHYELELFNEILEYMPTRCSSSSPRWRTPATPRASA